MARLIFLGAPGAGKGTQAQVVANLCQIPHISTGDILRSAVLGQTPLGQKAQSYMDRGELVPDQLVIDLIRERMVQLDCQSGWILDGFPRTVAQASFLDDLLKEINQNYDHAVNLEVPDEILIARLLNRGRKDDAEDVIRRRLQVYREQTAPLIDYYQSRQRLVLVNGDAPQDKVTAEIKQLI